MKSFLQSEYLERVVVDYELGAVHADDREEKPKTICESDEQRNLEKRLATMPTIKKEAQKVDDCSIEFLVILDQHDYADHARREDRSVDIKGHRI